MEPNRSPAATGRETSTLVNALVGGVAGVVLSAVPFSPVLGGALASYLDGGTPENGIKIGALAGLVMLLPFVFLIPLVIVFLGFAAPGGIELLVILVFGIVVFGVYTVGLSALGGYLGIYLRDEF